MGGRTDPDSAADVVGALRDAGATWWDERMVQAEPGFDRLEPVLRRIEQGPPTI